MLKFPGFNPGKDPPLLRELWEYNILRNEWREVSCHDTPDTLASHAVALLGNKYNENVPHKLVSFGGNKSFVLYKHIFC